VLGSPTARAETAPDASLESKKVCVEAHEQAQVLRRTGKLVEARSALLVCSQGTCPSAIQVDCADWRDQVNRSLPSVVVRATLGDKDEFDVRVSIDGNLTTSRLDGASISLDPGAHSFRFEHAPFEPVVQDVLLVEGEQNRVLSVSFGATKLAPLPVPMPPVHEAPSADVYRPIPPLAWVLGGTALVGTGSFVAFGLWGKEPKTLPRVQLSAGVYRRRGVAGAYQADRRRRVPGDRSRRDGPRRVRGPQSSEQTAFRARGGAGVVCGGAAPGRRGRIQRRGRCLEFAG